MIKEFKIFINEGQTGGIIPILMMDKRRREEEENSRKKEHHFRDFSFTKEQIDELKSNGFEVVGTFWAYKIDGKYKTNIRARFSSYELTIEDVTKRWFSMKLEQKLYIFDAMLYNYKKFIEEHKK